MSKDIRKCRDCRQTLDSVYILNGFRNLLCLACFDLRLAVRKELVYNMEELEPKDAPLGYQFMLAKSESKAKQIAEYQYEKLERINYNYSTGELDIVLEH